MARHKKYPVALKDDEVLRLKKKLRDKDTSKTIANRCRVLLELDTSHPPVLYYKDCAAKFGLSQSTVSHIVKQYHEEGLDPVLTYKRNENSNRANRKVDGRLEAEIIKLACGPVPEGYARWSIRLLARELFVLLGDEAVSADTIRRTLKKTGFALTKATTGASLKSRTQNS
ncbi:MAG: helix-turn-helix domain-containing protein [Veillonellaceae bacterium]|jgi:transposase|nr:helix-turn-helix domain-containing protein [Veillonellaceae bacterium]